MSLIQVFLLIDILIVLYHVSNFKISVDMLGFLDKEGRIFMHVPINIKECEKNKL